MPTTSRSDALLELGAATLGEIGPARCGRRASAPRGPAPGSRRRRSRCAARRATTSGSTSRSPRRTRATRSWSTSATSASSATGARCSRPARRRAGWPGLVIDGGVRDIAEIQAHGFPVFSTMIALRGATKNQAGTVGRPDPVRRRSVEPGDWVVGDADGVVVVPGRDDRAT